MKLHQWFAYSSTIGSFLIIDRQKSGVAQERVSTTKYVRPAIWNEDEESGAIERMLTVLTCITLKRSLFEDTHTVYSTDLSRHFSLHLEPTILSFD